MSKIDNFPYPRNLFPINNNNNNNNNLICIAPACRMTSEALADSLSRATECLTEKYCFKSAFKSTNRATV